MHQYWFTHCNKCATLTILYKEKLSVGCVETMYLLPQFSINIKLC